MFPALSKALRFTVELPAEEMPKLAVPPFTTLVAPLPIQYRSWFTPLPESEAERFTVTAVLFQPFAFGAGTTAMFAAGAIRSTLAGYGSSTTPLRAPRVRETLPP